MGSWICRRELMIRLAITLLVGILLSGLACLESIEFDIPPWHCR